jgi:hypothetical protein
MPAIWNDALQGHNMSIGRWGEYVNWIYLITVGTKLGVTEVNSPLMMAAQRLERLGNEREW